ncbi:NBR1-Ig-like domain-containing protein [Asanoa sp. NPDC049573]|uniref:NBR1-Ig-like domain-containing protein n=1 Tax=Asanoa sp. NPDC049573 TaxID=3155396 RepID=UPI00341F55FD
MRDQGAAAESTQDGSAAVAFAEQLRSLRTAVGDPSFRKMAGRSGRISHTTLHEAAAGTRFPSWETTREFVRACDADETEWRRRWEEAHHQDTVHTVLPRTDLPGGVVVADTVDTMPSGAPAAQVAGPRRLRWLGAGAVAALVLVAILGLTVRGRGPATLDGAGTAAASPTTTPFSDSLIPGDSSKFIGDVTIPDGTRVKVNQHFTKVWALANVGKVDWHNRFLARADPTVDADGCQVPDRVAIGDTPPGEQVKISVPVVAPDHPGKCWVSWKMVDENGQQYFPSRRPVYFEVTVVA